jgi:predicted house-cleaning noncanonical NTP pyrophosphatase (MazG superfamily)
MGLDDMLKQQIRDRAPELKEKLVNEFSEVTQKDMDEASDDPDEIVDRVQKKTGQPREQVEQRVQKVMQQG